MKAKLIVNNKEFEIEIAENELKKLEATKLEQKKTGYERKRGNVYWYANYKDKLEWDSEYCSLEDDEIYATGNYYSSKEIAENNVRADRLMRQLRRFAVTHRERELIWGSYDTVFLIYYDYDSNKLKWCDTDSTTKDLGLIYFDSSQTAEDAIDAFRDELIWYFTEYRDSVYGKEDENA